MPVIKTVGIVSKPNSPAAGALVSKLIEWLGQRGIAAGRVHQFVHHLQPGHGVLGIERGAAVSRADSGIREPLR